MFGIDFNKDDVFIILVKQLNVIVIYVFTYKIKYKGDFVRYAHGYKKKLEMESWLKDKGISFKVVKRENKPNK